MKKPFEGFDLSDFWAESESADEEYVDDPLIPEKVAKVEQMLGCKLPTAYIALTRISR